MAIDLKPEEKTVGTANFHRAVGKLGVTRREFLNGMLAAGAAVPLGAAAYFGYNAAFGDKPVKAGLIGAGDEGGVLVGEHNPRYLEFVAYSDIRPSNQKRIFEGEAVGPRKGFNYHYGSDARSKIKLYENYHQLLEDKDIEAVVIALPLNLHYQVTVDALKAGKHVLCEKLMARDIRQCKKMIEVAEDREDGRQPRPDKVRVLSIGHQRHYSMLYAHANDVVKSDVLGDIRHIRAQWHRNNSVPGKDSWFKNPSDEDKNYLNAVVDGGPRLAGFTVGEGERKWHWKNVDQLVRWRLYQETGAGLMAELGSHQLDACSIFLGKRQPLAVSGVGGKYFYKDDRQVEDHVYCTFEFPGNTYNANAPADPNLGNRNRDVVIVTYSSINTNDFEPYGECVMGSKGTLIVEKEEAAYLFGRGPRSTSVSVAAGGALQASSTTPGADTSDRKAQDLGQASMGGPPPSKGYREEMEHFAYIIRNRGQGMASDAATLKPRCDGRAALNDAIMALVANMAMAQQKRIEFDPKWFNADDPAVPE
jgi:predicted dehydrogenase